MIFREVADSEFRPAEDNGKPLQGMMFFCPYCGDWYFWDNDNISNYCEHIIFSFQIAKGCIGCDIAALYGLKNKDALKQCSGCWNFCKDTCKDAILHKAKITKEKIYFKNESDIVSYYKRYFELIGISGVDEIVYKYVENPSFHQGWHFYAFGISKQAIASDIV